MRSSELKSSISRQLRMATSKEALGVVITIGSSWDDTARSGDRGNEGRELTRKSSARGGGGGGTASLAARGEAGRQAGGALWARAGCANCDCGVSVSVHSQIGDAEAVKCQRAVSVTMTRLNASRGKPLAIK